MTTDTALEAVYGFDQDGLENEWRASVGLPPREGTAQPDDDEPVPTLPPADGGDTGDATDEGDGGGTSAGAIIGLVLAILAASAVIAFAARVLARRFRP